MKSVVYRSMDSCCYDDYCITSWKEKYWSRFIEESIQSCHAFMGVF